MLTQKKAHSLANKLVASDPLLPRFADDIRLRWERYAGTLAALCPDGSLANVSRDAETRGLHHSSGEWVVREWFPDAEKVSLIGEFNNWNTLSCPLNRAQDGLWEAHLPENTLKNGQMCKLHVEFTDGRVRDVVSPYANRVVQMPDRSFCSLVWDVKYRWRSKVNWGEMPTHPLIYESHIGMAQEEPKVGSYREFESKVLPRIKAAGYDTLQLMAVMQHPYYGSFGYQVTNLFAASSWFGTPEDLKHLIDTAHEMGIAVIMDVVHAHVSLNTAEGLAGLDENGGKYFLKGQAGYHSAWGTRLYDYGRHDTLRLLLSNLRYWMKEFRFDGFRFDGVTSMLYHDHGLGCVFDSFNKYYSLNSNLEAAVYLMLANKLVHSLNKNAITIAEDMSGMPGMAAPLEAGGFGFDYRLNMGVPDMWIRLVKDTEDAKWDMSKLYYELTRSRPGEKQIGYSESHDQALVGDKTLMFRMADAAMYDSMRVDAHNHVIDRAMALEKMIRMLTLTLACNGYLNFMGNEFGHPEWIDFPREGNNWSYHYARRQWSLADDPSLKYSQLAAYDRDLLALAKKHAQLEGRDEQLWVDERRRLLAYRKNGLVYLFNFAAWTSYPEFFLPTHDTGEYRCIFSTDRTEYGGFGHVDEDYVYTARSYLGSGEGFSVYIPARTAAVFCPVK